MRFDILTIFPEFFRGFFEHGVVSRAQKTGLIAIAVRDLREFTHDRHRTVDDRPFGGGEGMVLKAEPLAEALAALSVAPVANRDAEACARETVVLLSAQGRPFTQAVARELAGLERIVLICGRYEGIDERVNQLYCDREISIGDYVLSGGELAAAVVLSLFFGQLFRIVQALEMMRELVSSRQHHRRRHHRPKQRSAAYLIYPGNQPRPFSPSGLLKLPAADPIRWFSLRAKTHAVSIETPSRHKLCISACKFKIPVIKMSCTGANSARRRNP